MNKGGDRTEDILDFQETITDPELQYWIILIYFFFGEGNSRDNAFVPPFIVFFYLWPLVNMSRFGLFTFNINKDHGLL